MNTLDKDVFTRLFYKKIIIRLTVRMIMTIKSLFSRPADVHR